jgi:nitric oxide reductase large subunit
MNRKVLTISIWMLHVGFRCYVMVLCSGVCTNSIQLHVQMRNDATLARPNVLAVRETLQHIVGGVGINRNIAPSPN